MSKTREKMHPGARMFGFAMAGIRTPTNHRKCKAIDLKDNFQSSELTHEESSRQTKIAEMSVPVFPDDLIDSLQNETHLPSYIADIHQENTTPDKPSVEDDYSLPVSQPAPPPGFDMSPANLPNSQYYTTSQPFSYPENPMHYSSEFLNHSENSMYYSPGYFNHTENSMHYSPGSFKHTENSMYYSPGSFNHTENSMYYSPGSFDHTENLMYSPSSLTPSMVSWEHFNPSAQCSDLEPKSSDVYAFSVSTIPSDGSGPNDSCQSSVDPLNESTDYDLPLKLPGGSQDSGCLSSEEDDSLPCSLSYYHMVNSSESPTNQQQALKESSPDESVSQPKTNSDTVISGRVSRRSISRVQGSSTRLSLGNKPAKIIPIPRKSLPVATPQYVPAYVSDDSGAEVSPDDDAGCTGCEQESELLYKADSQKRWRSLPDYSRLNFLTLKSDPGFIDSHCHLDFLFQRQNYDGTYADYMFKHRDSYPVSYEGCVAVFCNPHTFHKKTMWQRYLNEDGVWGAFGCHPHNANIYSDLMERDLCAALLHPKVRALGEIGLDYSNRNDCSKERQHLVFRRQLKIALSRKLPLVIHCRDANEDIMSIMKEIVPKNHTIHLHCFTDGWDWAQEWLEQFPNLFIGITNLVTYNSAEPTHEVARKIPLDRLLLETDAPYFIPRRIPRTTKFSHPGMAIHVAAQIATLRGVPLKEIIHMTRRNTEIMYGI